MSGGTPRGAGYALLNVAITSPGELASHMHADDRGPATAISCKAKREPLMPTYVAANVHTNDSYLP